MTGFIYTYIHIYKTVTFIKRMCIQIVCRFMSFENDIYLLITAIYLLIFTDVSFSYKRGTKRR